MKKLFTLLMLLVAIVTGAQAYESASGDVSLASLQNPGNSLRFRKAADGVYMLRGSGTWSYSSSYGIKTQNNTGYAVFYLDGSKKVTLDILHRDSKSSDVTASVFTLTEDYYKTIYEGTENSTTVSAITGSASSTFTITVGTTNGETVSGDITLEAGYYAILCSGSASNIYLNALHFEASGPSDPTFTVSPSTIEVGGTATITGPEGLNFSATVKSSDPEGAVTVSGGTITGVSAGTAVITVSSEATSSYNAYSNDFTVNVVAAKTTATLAYAPTSASLTLGDDWTSPTFTATPTGAASAVSYSSNNTSVATVASDGTITLAGGVGTAVITASITDDATYSDASTSYTVTVNEPEIVYQDVDLTKGYTWDFTQTADEDWTNLGKDATNWNKESDTRFGNKTALDGYVIANYYELAATAGLKVKGGADNKIRINKNATLGLNGGGLAVTIPSLVAGQVIKVYAYSGKATATDRNLDISSNVSKDKNFSSSGTGEEWGDTSEPAREFIGTVQTDGNVIITTIKGGVNIQKIIVTEPIPASIDLTINADAGATTVYSDYALDFSTLTNVKAYIETGTGDKLSWTQVTSAPAKTGLLVVSSEPALTVPTAASSETVVTGNRLKGVATGESKDVTADDNIYIFTLHEGKPGFIKSNTGRSLLVGKAYLDLGGATGAREFFELFEDGTTTGISSIDNDQLTTDNDAPAYNLAGQKVGKGYKGIVIINGKKVVK